MKQFLIGETDFGIGDVKVEIDASTAHLTLEISGDTQTFEERAKAEWRYHPVSVPVLYISGPYQDLKGIVSIQAKGLFHEKWMSVLYFLEETDFYGSLEIRDENRIINIEGECEISDEIYKISINIE
jgi:hypothetical protein